MTDRKFRHLSRTALVDIIYELQKNNQSLQDQLMIAQQQLEEKYIVLSHAGTLAEAVVGLNKLMETAQKTAEDYLDQVRHLTDRQIRQRYETLCSQEGVAAGGEETW